MGTSVLEGIATIGQSTTSLDVAEVPQISNHKSRPTISNPKTSERQKAQVKSVSAQMVSLISNLGSAALASLQPGATQEITSVESGEGIKMAVAKPSTSQVT